MNKEIKELIKRLPLAKLFINLFLYPTVKVKKLSKKIDRLFSDLSSSIEIFNKTPKIPNLIISLTSFPARMKFIEFTIFSLIKQTIRPEKIVLWLSEKEFINKENDVSDNLYKYKQFGLEIKFAEDNFRSYNKLIFSIKEYSNFIIVTADDDVCYKPNWLKLLYSTHMLFPQDIISNKIRRITFSNKQIDPYLTLKNRPSGASFLNILLGYSGVLYPPDKLYKDLFDSHLFLELCPYADDIWFFVMALLANTKIRKPNYFFRRISSFDYQLSNEWKKIPELMKVNWIENRNDNQLKAVLKYYDLYDHFFINYA